MPNGVKFSREFGLKDQIERAAGSAMHQAKLRGKPDDFAKVDPINDRIQTSSLIS